MTEYPFEKMLAFLVYSVSLWMFCRFWYGNVSKDANNQAQTNDIVPPSISTERFKNERLINENRQLKTENEQLKTECEQLKTKLEQRNNLYAKNKQLTDDIKTLTHIAAPSKKAGKNGQKTVLFRLFLSYKPITIR